MEFDKSFMDIISVDRERGVAYVAYYSGVKDLDYPAHWTWTTNVEVSLKAVEKEICKEGKQLPDGYLDNWIRIKAVKYRL